MKKIKFLFSKNVYQFFHLPKFVLRSNVVFWQTFGKDFKQNRLERNRPISSNRLKKFDLEIRGQFQQYFTTRFIEIKCFEQLSCSYKLCLYVIGKIMETGQKLLIKCW